MTALEPIKTIELPAGEYLINGKQQKVYHSFIVSTALTQSDTKDAEPHDVSAERKAALEWFNGHYRNHALETHMGGFQCCQAIATIRKALSAPEKDVEGLVKALEYCAQDPRQMNPMQQAQFMVAKQALSTYQNSVKTGEGE
jgi:hypothetical protein